MKKFMDLVAEAREYVEELFPWDVDELIKQDKIKLSSEGQQILTFHDPCYLGRQNDILIDPRQVLAQTQANLVGLPRSGQKSFCCGAGGAQM